MDPSSIILQKCARDLLRWNWSQHKIAVAIGTTQSTISNIASGKTGTRGNGASFRVGYGLVRLHARIKGQRQAARAAKKAVAKAASQVTEVSGA